MQKLKIFSLSANRQLAQEIADEVGVPLSECDTKMFADGETMVNIKTTVRGFDVFIIQPTCAPHVNQYIMELLIMIDALKRASAKSINIVMPYYGYSRQDRKARAREPITSKLVADLLQTAGASRIITMDLHASQIQGFFNIPIDDFKAMPTISKYIKSKKIDSEKLCVVSPDHGGAIRARKLGDYLNTTIAIVDKRRPKPNVSEVMGIVGDVKGKICIIIDDMIDTAGTLTHAADALIAKGAIEVYACATHAIFSEPALQRIADSQIKEVIVTNTIPLLSDVNREKITVLSVGPLLGKAVLRVFNEEAVSSLFEVNKK